MQIFNDKGLFEDVSDSISLYLDDISGFPILSKEEEAYLVDLRDSGDEKAIEKLVNCNLKWAFAYSKRFIGLGLDFADIIQYANEGLIKAAYMYKKTESKFTTYATFWMKQAILRGIENDSRTVRVPSYMYNIHYKLRKMVKNYYGKFGKFPSDEEIALDLGIDVSKIKEVKLSFADYLFLDQPIGDVVQSYVSEFISDNSVSVEYEAMQKMLVDDISYLFADLTEEECDIIFSRFFLDGDNQLSFEEIGNKYGYSKQNAESKQKKILNKMRQKALAMYLQDYLTYCDEVSDGCSLRLSRKIKGD